ncbi:RimK family alpha-L-glutamate ligase [Amycolatopsis sp. lyj-84]|uniref:ATP-grasp domain-containing protein n=1 Tax=Amycolatopsis sp. lyj-84 TaxID=2789284 RepID=UPI00397A81E3
MSKLTESGDKQLDQFASPSWAGEAVLIFGAMPLPYRVAVATAACSHTDDHDTPLLLRKLTDAGFRAEAAFWHTPQSWAEFDLVLIRSPWDYAIRVAEFRNWTQTVSRETMLANSAEIVLWNMDKHYLRELAAAGLPVVDTSYLALGQPLPQFDHDIVVKPAISAGALNTGRYRAGDPRAVEHVRMLQEQGQTAMVQPYLDTIDTAGEHALVFLDGEFSHAMAKGAVLTAANGIDNSRFPHPNLQPYEPTSGEIRLATEALAAIPDRLGTPLYARIDVVTAGDDSTLMELELIEPNLFLPSSPSALDRFVKAIEHHIRARQSTST